jgi:hypothetical protein
MKWAKTSVAEQATIKAAMMAVTIGVEQNIAEDVWDALIADGCDLCWVPRLER